MTPYWGKGMWRTTIKGGKPMREAIYNGDNTKVAEYLVKAWEEIGKFERCSAKKRTAPITRKLESKSGFSNEYLDKKLSEFYDYCDYQRYWVDF